MLILRPGGDVKSFCFYFTLFFGYYCHGYVFSGSAVATKSVEERLAELEANQNLQYLSLSGFLISTYDNISASESYPSQFDSTDLQYLRLRFSLNADAEINSQVRVFSRTTVTKFMNNWRSQGGAPYDIPDVQAVYANTGSGVYLEKAYVDLSCPDSIWTLSVGRLPTVNGSPEHFWDMLPPQGTYPLLSFDAPLDGLALTYRGDRWVSAGQELTFRFLYTPFIDVLWGGPYSYLKPPTNDTNGTAQVGADDATMVNMGTVQMDYAVRTLPYADEIAGTLQYYRSGELSFSSGQGTSDLKAQTNGVTALVDLLGLRGSGWDISLSHTYTDVSSSGELAPGLGFGTDGEDGSNYGSLTLLSLRHRWESWAAGGEWLVASDVPFYFSGAPEDLTDFYMTPGNSYHLYLTKKWLSLVTLRLGYRHQSYNQLPISFGTVASTDRKIETFYTSLRTDF